MMTMPCGGGHSALDGTASGSIAAMRRWHLGYCVDSSPASFTAFAMASSAAFSGNPAVGSRSGFGFFGGSGGTARPITVNSSLVVASAADVSAKAVQVADNPQRPRAVNAAAQSEYARLAGMSEAALTAAMEPYLPIARVQALFGRSAPALRDMLVQRLEASLCPQGWSFAWALRSVERRPGPNA